MDPTMEPTQPATPPQYVEPGQPVRRVETVQPVQPVQLVEPVEPVRPVRPVRAYGTPDPVFRVTQLIYTILGIVEVLLAIRVVMKLLDANPGAAFTAFMYSITDPLVAFFQGVFPEPQSNGSMLELSALLAMAVYALLAWAIVRVIEISSRRQPPATV
jgi:uncharacterized protein YggT (Ycf19 family)